MAGQNIQLGSLTSEITVIDEDELLTREQLEKITNEVMRQIEQRMQVLRERESDQSVQSSVFSRQEWMR